MRTLQQLFFFSSLIWVSPLLAAEDTPQCGFPGYKARKHTGIFLWNDCFSDQWHIRAVSGKAYAKYKGTLEANPANITLNGLVSVESNDKVNLPDFELKVKKKDEDGFDFLLTDKACLTINAPKDTAVYAGKNRVALPTSISLPAFQPCNGPKLEYLFDNNSKRGQDTGDLQLEAKLMAGAYVTSSGFAKNALYIDGRKEHALISDSQDLNMPQYTMMAWVRSRKTKEKSQMIIEKAAALWLNIRDTGYVRTGGFFGGCGNENFFRMDSTKPISREVWNHVAVTNDQYKLRIYINGELSGEEDLPTQKPYCANKGPFNIGSMYRNSKADSGSYFYGYIDSVRVYDEALSQDKLWTEMFRD